MKETACQMSSVQGRKIENEGIISTSHLMVQMLKSTTSEKDFKCEASSTF